MRGKQGQGTFINFILLYNIFSQRQGKFLLILFYYFLHNIL